jgi:hypothetical protein
VPKETISTIAHEVYTPVSARKRFFFGITVVQNATKNQHPLMKQDASKQ